MLPTICPWWLGYALASPARRLIHDPRAILSPFVSAGMTVLEPGPGMGFFTLELARLVGPRGRVVAIDLQPKMLAALRRRADRKGLVDRIELREAKGGRMGTGDLGAAVDFLLAFAVVHELTDIAGFFAESYQTLKPSGKALVVEPSGHVSAPAFAATLALAERAGFVVEPGPSIRRSRSAVLTRRDG
jgi:ubiquinone/menaquinone biosynthesis C-methylase UbiE